MAGKNWTLDEVRELLIQLWPEGVLYDWYNTASAVYGYLDGIAQSLLTYCINVLDTLRTEANPSTVVQKLPDWEATLGLSSSYAALNGTTAQRQSNVIGKLREFGAFSVSDVRAVIGPILGYTDPTNLQIVETSRSALTAAHTYGDSSISSVSIPDSGSVSKLIRVADDGVVSRAGAQLTVTLTHPAVEQITITLTAPDGTAKTWSNLGSGTVTQKAFLLFAPSLAGAACGGTWKVVAADTVSGSTGTLDQVQLFVEGIGAGGLGGAIYEWGVYADTNYLGPDFDFAAATSAIARVQHAHAKGYLLQSVAAICDYSGGDQAAIPDQCLPS